MLTQPSAASTPEARGRALIIALANLGLAATGAVKPELGDADITGNTSLLLLCELGQRGPMRPRQLLELSGLTSGGLTKQLDHLEQAGVIERSFGTLATDRRGSIVALTDKGLAIVDRLGRVMAENLDALRGPIREITDLMGS